MKQNITIEQFKELNDDQIIYVLELFKEDGDSFEKDGVISSFNAFKLKEGYNQYDYFEFSMNDFAERLTIGKLLEVLGSEILFISRHIEEGKYDLWCVNYKANRFDLKELVDALWEAFKFIAGEKEPDFSCTTCYCRFEDNEGNSDCPFSYTDGKGCKFWTDKEGNK